MAEADPYTSPAPGPTLVPVERFRLRAMFMVPLLAFLVLDLLSKQWLFARYWPWQAHYAQELPGWIELHKNPGVAWGMFGDHPGIVTGLTSLLIPLIFWYYWRYVRQAGWMEHFAFGCIIGGAIGNMYDRILTNVFHSLGGVRDFIKVDLNMVGIDYVWPIFNIADAGITTGFIALLLASFLVKPSKPDGTVPQSPAGNAANAKSPTP